MPAVSLFPSYSVRDAAVLAETIAKHNAGQPMRRLDIFHQLERAPDSGPSRSLITASGGYGLTEGGYKAELLKLTDRGRRFAVDGDETALVEAVLAVEVFKKFFDHYANNQFPSEVPAKSYLASLGVSVDRTEACLAIAKKCGHETKLVQERSGAERVMSVAAAQEALGKPHLRGSAADEPPKGPNPDVPPTPSSAWGGSTGLPSININLEIHLPASASPETYDSIFKGIREHLIDGRPAD